MFSSKKKLDSRTGAYGIGRLSYLQSLVEEFQTSEISGSKREVLANLANFAYDPVNYDFFRQLNILDLFLDCLADEEDKDPSLKLFALTGVCNSCLDQRNKSFYLSNGCVKLVSQYLFWDDGRMIMQSVTSLMYLMNRDSKKEITCEKIKIRMTELSESKDKRISNLATIFLEDYVKK